MIGTSPYEAFLSYDAQDSDAVTAIAQRLYGESRLTFWFKPWHSIPGVPIQEQMEGALQEASSCAVFVGRTPIQGWQNEQMRAAIQRRVEDNAAYRVIPVLLPGTIRPKRSDLPPFLRRFETVEFQSPDDEIAFKRLLAGILGIPPIQVEGYIQAKQSEAKLLPPPTAIVFFSGHGGYNPAGGDTQQYLLPYDCDPLDLPGTAITGDEMTRLLREIKAGRLLVLFDSCHSGGAGDPKGELAEIKLGLSEDYYRKLAAGKGRVVMASSRPDEVSWVLSGMNNSLYTHYLLEALRGEGKTLGDGYVRVFDVFRHVAEHVPAKASQHPVFKAAALEQDFAIALVGQGAT